jgi:hypothetical protein
MTTTLNSFQQEIFAYCKSGKTTKTIAAHFACSHSKVYNAVSLLQRLGLMTRIGAGSRNMYAIYVSADLDLDEQISHAADISDFIKCAHDPFNLARRTSFTQLDTSL